MHPHISETPDKLKACMYLDIELGHDLLGFAVMSNDAIHSLRYIVQDQVEV